MRRSTGIKLAAAAILAALLGSTASSSLALANDTDAASTAATSTAATSTVSPGGIPALVDPAADLAAKTPGPAEDWADSIYFTSRVTSDGHDIGLLVHTVRLPEGPGNLLLVSAHDATTGWYESYATRFDESDYSWLDRQWGPNVGTPGNHWSWMNFNMPNGDAVALWDAVSADGETHTWATVLRKDGSYDVAAVVPLAEDARKFWTSPTTGQSYPTRWVVNIPALDTRLRVRVVGNPDQEIILGSNGRLEATARFEGTYDGARVSGKNFAEMFGDWPSS